MQIVLYQLTRDDFSIIRDWIDPAIFHVFSAPIDDGQLENLLSRDSDGALTEIGLRAVDCETDEIVGLLHSVLDRDNDSLHIQQIVVDPARRGRGYGAAILTEFLRVCFEEHSLHRVQLFTEEINRAAIACYTKVGFKVDGLLRDRVKIEGGYLGTYIFSMVADDWQSASQS